MSNCTHEMGRMPMLDKTTEDEERQTETIATTKIGNLTLAAIEATEPRFEIALEKILLTRDEKITALQKWIKESDGFYQSFDPCSSDICGHLALLPEFIKDGGSRAIDGVPVFENSEGHMAFAKWLDVDASVSACITLGTGGLTFNNWLQWGTTHALKALEVVKKFHHDIDGALREAKKIGNDIKTEDVCRHCGRVH